MYYGDELGMHDVAFDGDQVLDLRGQAMPNFGRDPARPPMQWHDGPAAGFSTRTPWLPPAADYRHYNVAAQQEAGDSLLNLYRRSLKLRCQEMTLQVGDYRRFRWIAAAWPMCTATKVDNY